MKRKCMIFLRLVALLSLVLPHSVSSVSAEDAREKVVIAQFGKEKFLLYLPLYVAMEEGLSGEFPVRPL